MVKDKWWLIYVIGGVGLAVVIIVVAWLFGC